MAKEPRLSASVQEAAELGLRAAQAGNFELARQQLEKAVKAKPDHSANATNLAIVCEQIGDNDTAASLYTRILRRDPANERALKRVASIARRFTISDPGTLDPFGLLAVLNAPTTDPQSLAKNVLAHLASTTGIGEYLKNPSPNAITNSTPEWLTNTLFLTLLERTRVTSPELETALTTLRNATLRLDKERFSDRSLTTFLIALARQCDRTEHVFKAPKQVAEYLATFPLDHGQLISGNRDHSTALLVHALFNSPLSLLPTTTQPDELGKVRPDALRSFFQQRLHEHAVENTLRSAFEDESIQRMSDDTSQRVAQQYENNPYPRWDTIQLPPPGWLNAQIKTLLPTHDTSFLDQQYNVLIAGCGTGRQACQAALGYGPSNKITAIDLSAASLAYAARKASEFGIDNIGFKRQNILDLDPTESTFDIIECLGVLHHMADPFEGWRKLGACLKPGGIMQIALYSAIARQNIAALRSASDYPGPDCDAEVARAYREKLRAITDDDDGGKIKTSPDFYTLSTFRDLVLHQSEQTFSLGDIDKFLKNEGFTFAGFVLDSVWLEDFLDEHPDQEIPGSLAAWDEYERANPNLFEGMYQFWMTKSQ